MSKRLTRNSLGIFWRGEEVEGILVYGFWDNTLAKEPVFPTKVWGSDVEWKTRRLFGDTWVVWLWEIRVSKWPSTSEWSNVIRMTLEAMKTEGAKVAWCGLEGFFVEPPKLFDSTIMSGGVWAVLGNDGVLFGPPPLDANFVPVPDNLLEELKKKIT